MPGERIVYVLDDKASVRRSLAQLLKSAGYVPVCYEAAAAFLAVAPELSTGCVLLVQSMRGVDGLELHTRLQDGGSHLPVVMMMGGNGEVQTAVRGIRSGTLYFLDNPFSDQALFSAIKGACLNAGVTSRQREIADAARRVTALTPRERQVLEGLVAGHPNKSIARDLSISVRTVEVHRGRMMRRLGTRRLAVAIRLAVMASLAFPKETRGGEGH